jgi:hypothetical protein
MEKGEWKWSRRGGFGQRPTMEAPHYFWTDDDADGWMDGRTEMGDELIDRSTRCNRHV